MKKLVFFLLITYLFTLSARPERDRRGAEGLLAGKASAQTVTPTPAPDDPDQAKIDKTIDLVASIAAKLGPAEKRGIIGQVSDVANSKITLSDINNNTRFVDVDEFTKFSSPSAKEGYGISDIKKGSKLGILGLYNKQSRRILARFVDVVIIPKMVEGAVVEKDEEEFVITIISEDKTQTAVDIEKVTKTSSFDKKEGLLRSGFSRIEKGERITVVGFPDQKEKNRLIASRIIHFPTIPKNPRIQLDLEKTTAPSSTGSGKKLTPITR